MQVHESSQADVLVVLVPFCLLFPQFKSPDEEMKKIVLKVVKQCVATDGVQKEYVKEEIVPPFFKNFWIKRMALDRRNYKQLVCLSLCLWL